MARQIWLGKCGEMVFADKTKRGDICKFNTEKMGQCLGGGLLSLSLSLSLSLVARTFSTLKFLNALFMRFCALFVILSLCKKATQRVARRKPQQKNPYKLKETLPFLDTSLPLSMTNSSFCLKITDIFTQILKHKFKFFTQNSRHFIKLSQISSPTQGFFIFLPQIFEQFLLINLVERRSYGNKKTEK